METKTNLEDLRCPLSDARKCLTILLANAQEALADIPVTEERPTESELPGNKLLGWVNAGEVIFRTLTYLNHLEHGINDTDRYIDELLAKASPKPAPASSSPKQPNECSTEVRSEETGPTPVGSTHITPDDVVMLPAGALLDYFFECGSTPGSSISVGEHICWSELGFQADVLNLVRSYRQLAGRLPAAELLDASPDRIVAALAKRADGVRVLTAELQKVEGGVA